jgi:DNA-directed RNA polymerase specialized sigma subunit
MIERFRAVLAGWPEADRKFMQWRMDGLSFAEIEKELGVSNWAVFRLNRKLEARLAEAMGMELPKRGRGRRRRG